MKLILLTVVISLTATFAHSATVAFTDLGAWQSAAAGWNSDTFASATPGGPQPAYVSPLGVTIRRSSVLEESGDQFTATVDYNGDLTVTSLPYRFQSSRNQLQVITAGLFPDDNALVGPDAFLNSTTGSATAVTTRYPDGATRLTTTDYLDRVNQSTSEVTGGFDTFTFGFGFLYNAWAGPYPGAFHLEVNGESFTVPVLPGFGTFGGFFGIHSTDPISSFRLSASRGPEVTSSSSFTNQPCYAPPGFEPLPPGSYEVCLNSGFLATTTSSISSQLNELFVATGSAPQVLSSTSAVHTPEPATALLVAAALPLLRLVRRRG